MKQLADIYSNTGTLHHAYVLIGDTAKVRAELVDFFEHVLGERVVGNPDFFIQDFSAFTIDDARALREQQHSKSFSDARKLVVLSVVTMTVEAQNALLKMFEEPTAGTHFFILTRSRDVLLPTVLSRVQLFVHDAHEHAGRDENVHHEQDEHIQSRKFLIATYPDRLQIVASYIEAKDAAATLAFVDGLIAVLHEQKNAAKRSYAKLEMLLTMRSFLLDRSPSHKLVLEHLALTL
jgi:hypothetical protein